PNARASDLGWLVYLGVVPTALGFTTWAYAIARTSAGRAGVVMYLQPPIAILLGWLLLGELPAPLALAGGAVCVAGVVVARTGATVLAPVAGWARALLPQLPARVWLVLLGSLVTWIGRGMVLPFLILYLSHARGLELGVAGAVSGATYLVP